jgi:hypothetical protein
MKSKYSQAPTLSITDPNVLKPFLIATGIKLILNAAIGDYLAQYPLFRTSLSSPLLAKEAIFNSQLQQKPYEPIMLNQSEWGAQPIVLDY